MEWGTYTILGYGRNEQVHHPLWISPDQGDAVEWSGAGASEHIRAPLTLIVPWDSMLVITVR